jgi:MarR family 2-MHQ and catechol resistance regulon transcriptional repressor
MIEDLDEQLLVALVSARNKVYRMIDRAMRTEGVTAVQFSVLELLDRSGCPLRVGDLGDNVLGSSGNLPLVVRHLSDAGHVVTSTDEKDRRVRMVAITQSGHEIVVHVKAKHATCLQNLFKTMSTDEKVTMIGLLGKVLEVDENVPR